MKMYAKTMPLLTLKKNDTGFKSCKIGSSSDAYKVIRAFYFDDISIYESFFILTLNRANNTTGYAKISQGGISGTIVDPRIIAKYAIENLANGVILAHNHPSGNLAPSDAYRQITRKITEGLKLLDVVVLDHIILTETSFYSFADEGILN